jgi:hypothetical protein
MLWVLMCCLEKEREREREREREKVYLLRLMFACVGGCERAGEKEREIMLECNM